MSIIKSYKEVLQIDSICYEIKSNSDESTVLEIYFASVNYDLGALEYMVRSYRNKLSTKIRAFTHKDYELIIKSV